MCLVKAARFGLFPIWQPPVIRWMHLNKPKGNARLFSIAWLTCANIRLRQRKDFRMIILQILLIPLVIFMMLGFVFVLGSSENGLSGTSEETDKYELNVDETIQSRELNSSATFSTTSAK
jgi:hypothetical protein